MPLGVGDFGELKASGGLFIVVPAENKKKSGHGVPRALRDG
jgi:hypothetical protein